MQFQEILKYLHSTTKASKQFSPAPPRHAAREVKRWYGALGAAGRVQLSFGLLDYEVHRMDETRRTLPSTGTPQPRADVKFMKLSFGVKTFLNWSTLPTPINRTCRIPSEIISDTIVRKSIHKRDGENKQIVPGRE